jgi:hypothetical protein
VFEPRIPISTLGEHGECGVENLVRPVVGAAFPSECFGGHGGGWRTKLSTLEYNIFYRP